MSTDMSFCKQLGFSLYRLVDLKQSEVRLSLIISFALEIVFAYIKLYSNFQLYSDDICAIFQSLIGAFAGLIGIAVAGVAIVIALFSAKQVEIIESIHKGAYERLLEDFKWLALIATYDIAIFAVMILIVRSPYPLIHVCFFYIISFILSYCVFYLFLYGCALVSNCIKLSKLKNTLETIKKQTKSISENAIEIQIDFLVSKLLKNNKDEAREYYSELIGFVEKSNNPNRIEIIEYIKNRYPFIKSS